MTCTEYITVSDNVRAVLTHDEMADNPINWGNTGAVLFTTPDRYARVPEAIGEENDRVNELIDLYNDGTGCDDPLPTKEALADAIEKSLVRQGLKPERKRLVGYSQGDVYEGVFWNPDGYEHTNADEFGAWAFGDVWLVHYEFSPTGLEEDYEPFNDEDGTAVYYGAPWDIIIDNCPPAPTYTRPAESPSETLCGLSERQMREVYEHQSQRHTGGACTS